MGALATLQAAGFSPDEIQQFGAQKRAALLAGGFSEKEADDYLGTAQRAASGPLEALQAGYQGSATGLIVRSKLPDVVLDPHHATWYEKALASVGQVVSEIPEMIVGGALGGAAGTAAGGAAGSVLPVVGTAGGAAVGGVLGTGAGAFAVPAAIRESYIQALSRGEVTSSGDFLNRAGIVLKETGKQALVGAATFGVGGAVARVAGKALAPAIGESLSVPAATRIISGAETGAQLGTMVVAPAALEGRLPEPEDFLNAAIVLGGLKGAGVVAGRLRAVYAKTNVPPEQVVADAARDPSIKADLTAEPKPAILGTVEAVKQETETSIPKAYKPLADAQVAAESVPVNAVKVADVMGNLEGKITAEKEPNHVNYKYVDGPGDVKAILARVSEVFTQEIADRRGAPKGWDASMEEARKALASSLGVRPDAIERGNLSLDAEILAKNAMTQRAAADIAAAARAIREKGAEAKPEDFARQAQAIETLAMVQANFLGNAAEIGRALNAMKAAKQARDLSTGLQDVLAKYGQDPHILARMIGEMDNVAQIGKFARTAAKATTLEQVLEGWKMSILSGSLTQATNFLGNTTFLAVRPMIDTVASSMGIFSGKADRVTLMEPIARISGNLAASFDMLKLAGSMLRAGQFGELAGKVFSKEASVKGEQYRAAIPGKTAEIARRATFGLLSSTDQMFKTLNERGEAYTLAVRDASAKGMNPLTREFREYVASFVDNPPEAVQKQITDAGIRFTFNTSLGEKGKALQAFIGKTPVLGFVAPFIRTPVNILKELVRLTPGAPLVKEWREAIKQGGAAQQKAIAELAVGTATMGAVAALAFDGTITGQGTPETGKRNVKRAAGWQPYSIKVDDTYYSYQSLQPVGTLIGLAADAAEVWDKMTEEESDKVPKMLAVAFANAVTNQTFLQGITNLVNVGSDPTRYGARVAQNYVASVVPAAIGQTVQLNDSVEREVNSMLDAIKARLPVARETLMPKLDVFGQPVETKERLGGITRITQTTESQDKVRSEAARLDISVANAPKKIHIGRGTGKLGDTKIEPEQTHVFAQVGGQLAHDILASIVNSPQWDELPDMVQRRIYQKVFTQAHKQAAIAALPPEQRLPLLQQIIEKVDAELAQGKEE